MAFKSEAHKAKMASLEKEGKVKKGTFAGFKKATGDSKLPERVSKSGTKPQKTKPIKSIQDLKDYRKSKHGV